MALEGIEDVEAMSVKAGVKMLELKGFEILEEDYRKFVVSRDGCCVAFCRVLGSRGRLKPVSESDREALVREFEEAIVDYFKQDGVEPDVAIRLDMMNVAVIADDRAVIKHFINVCNER